MTSLRAALTIPKNRHPGTLTPSQVFLFGFVVWFNLDSTVNLLNLHSGAEGGLTVDLDVADLGAGADQFGSDRLTEAGFGAVHYGDREGG